jgi:hypothetical protein
LGNVVVNAIGALGFLVGLPALTDDLEGVWAIKASIRLNPSAISQAYMRGHPFVPLGAASKKLRELELSRLGKALLIEDKVKLLVIDLLCFLLIIFTQDDRLI